MDEKELLAKAISFATNKHKNQKRRDGVEYINHPLNVANILKNAGYDEKYQIVAILHDVLEDTDATKEEVLYFGEDVYEAVKLLTRQKGANEAEYVAAILKNKYAAAVKNADKINNLWDCAFIGEVGKLRPEKAKEFAKRYIKKAEKNYKGKFSYALDMSIEAAKTFITCAYVEKKKEPNYTYEELMLYEDVRKKEYDESKKLYEKFKNCFDVKNPELVFYCVDGYYLCTIGEASFDVKDVWYLRQYGWFPMKESLVLEYEYDLRRCSKEEFVNELNRKIENKFFYDFVNTDLLI